MGLEAWLALLEQRHLCDIDLGLERCGAVYRRLGSPRPARQIFTVAGTNGKGSTVAYLAAMSAALGQRVGSYTSPHIFNFNERIIMLGEMVADACLVRAFEQVEKARAGVSLTYFEFTTLAALLVLEQADLDCAVLEVGLGGRLDTVNLVDPDCAIITPIALDHQDFLGSDINSIAAEKAGIIRAGVPLVCTQADPPGPVLAQATALQAPVYRRTVEFDLYASEVSVAPAGTLLPPLCFQLGDHSLHVPQPSMGGQHQRDNLAAALSALFLLNPGCFAKAEEISVAIRKCCVAGRLQLLGTAPEILLDVGHNALAADAVATYLQASARTQVTCVLAMLADKAAESVALSLGKVCQRWLCADSPGPRGQSGKALMRRLKTTLPAAQLSCFKTLDEAMCEAVASTGERDTILVFGSFSTVASVAKWVKKRAGSTTSTTL